MSAAHQDDVARLGQVRLAYGKVAALAGIDLALPAGRMVGLIGPDGVGKSSLLSLLAGARAMQHGSLFVLGGDLLDPRHRALVCPRIAYMPQGLGRNLYPTLSVEENLQFFGRLFGQDAASRRRRIDQVTQATGLAGFLQRPAGQLSGGMKQKLGLCCALIHDPELLILDEPTTGVDPLSRAQFWELIDVLRRQRVGMSVVVATAYMEEAERFDWLVAMDAGRILATGTPQALRARCATTTLEAAFIALLPADRRGDQRPLTIPPFQGRGDGDDGGDVAIEACGLSKRFGDFIAVDQVDLRIRRGEIFGFLGSNGCGKSTTMKMLTGLLPASSGTAMLFGRAVDAADMATRRRVGYMSQSFSLYGELTVAQNLVLHARLFGLRETDIAGRVAELAGRFGLDTVFESLPEQLPLGLRQRLSLAVAMVHGPELLLLDEPTSGVDPVARELFWRLLIELARREHVTIFISTHFMNEAERCDRIALMHAGHVLVSATPAALVAARGVATLEQAFIAHLREAGGQPAVPSAAPAMLPPPAIAPADLSRWRRSLGRISSYSLRETLELRRDPVRSTLALLGAAILMFIIGYGINMDVEHLSYAVLDRDESGLSRNYALNLAGSRYFIEQPPLDDHAQLDRRMRSGELALAIELPPGFGHAIARRAPVAVGAWVDGAMPMRAETTAAYVQAMHQDWLAGIARQRHGVRSSSPGQIETRYRYNPDVRSLPAMVPAVIPLLLMMIPAMLAALSVVREKELGSIINLYVTPVTRAEFLLGKQLPYIGLGMLNFMLLTLLAVTAFGVPLKGSLATLTLSALVYVVCSTGMGLLVSTFTRSQIAALFVTMIGTIIPCVQFAGLLNPVSGLTGAGSVIGHLYPATHFLTISRGVFNKALGMADLSGSLWPLLVAAPLILAASVTLLKKQERQ